jgi:hypothetical protein
LFLEPLLGGEDGVRGAAVLYGWALAIRIVRPRETVLTLGISNLCIYFILSRLFQPKALIIDLEFTPNM